MYATRPLLLLLLLQVMGMAPTEAGSLRGSTVQHGYYGPVAQYEPSVGAGSSGTRVLGPHGPVRQFGPVKSRPLIGQRQVRPSVTDIERGQYQISQQQFPQSFNNEIQGQSQRIATSIYRKYVSDSHLYSIANNPYYNLPHHQRQGIIDPYCSAPNGLFPHPNNCGLFISCAHGRGCIMECPISLHFNVQYQICMYQADANCKLDSTVDVSLWPLPFYCKDIASGGGIANLPVANKPSQPSQPTVGYPSVISLPTTGISIPTQVISQPTAVISPPTQVIPQPIPHQSTPRPVDPFTTVKPTCHCSSAPVQLPESQSLIDGNSGAAIAVATGGGDGTVGSSEGGVSDGAAIAVATDGGDGTVGSSEGGGSDEAAIAVATDGGDGTVGSSEGGGSDGPAIAVATDGGDGTVGSSEGGGSDGAAIAVATDGGDGTVGSSEGGGPDGAAIAVATDGGDGTVGSSEVGGSDGSIGVDDLDSSHPEIVEITSSGIGMNPIIPPSSGGCSGALQGSWGCCLRLVEQMATDPGLYATIKAYYAVKRQATVGVTNAETGESEKNEDKIRYQRTNEIFYQQQPQHELFRNQQIQRYFTPQDNKLQYSQYQQHPQENHYQQFLIEKQQYKQIPTQQQELYSQQQQYKQQNTKTHQYKQLPVQQQHQNELQYNHQYPSHQQQYINKQQEQYNHFQHPQYKPLISVARFQQQTVPQKQLQYQQQQQQHYQQEANRREQYQPATIKQQYFKPFYPQTQFQ